MSFGDDKRTARKRALARRDSLSAKERAAYDAAIEETVAAMSGYREAEVILAYASYRSEVSTRGLIGRALRDGKTVFAPKVAGDEMEFWRIASPADLQAGYRGIPEPAQSVSFAEWTGRWENGAKARSVMMWMPGAVFDMERHRIGYGGGFYDRYLAKLAAGTDSARPSDAALGYSLIVAALAYGCQIAKEIPHEAHDRNPDLIVTERGVIEGRKERNGAWNI